MAAAQTTRPRALLVVALVTMLARGAAAGARAEPEEAVAALARILSWPNASLPWRTPPHPVHDAWVWPTDISEPCVLDLLSLAKNYDQSWALKMVDASTKIPEGLLFGNVVHLGNFDECLSLRRGEAGGPPGFDGQHCLVTLSASASGARREQHVEWEVLELADATIAHFLGGRRARASSLTSVSVKVAWCAPSSCSPRYLQSIAAAAVDGQINVIGVDVDITTSVSELECHTPGGKPLRGIDIFAICLLCFFVACAAASTAYDVLTRKRANRPPLLLAFSLFSNWPKLLTVTRGRDQLSCLNGIRTISIGWVVLGHVYLINATTPAINLLDFMPEFVRSFKRLTIMNATVAVDTFFFMSGLLLSFIFLKEVEKTNRFNVIKFYVHRYVRLTPPLAILIFLTVTLMNYAGTGPLWEATQGPQNDACEKNWWTNLIYINNYMRPSTMCLGHTWYLAVDMQLYWLSPLVLIPLWKLPRRFALTWVCLLLLVGWAVPFTIVYLMELHAGTYVGTAQERSDTMKYYYWPTHARFVPWLLGTLLGYILREARKKKPELHPFVITLGWIVSTVFMTGALNAAYPFQQPDYVYNRLEAAFWLSLFRPMWALGLGWIIFACDQGFGGIVDIILSWSFFQPLARLSYGVYLTHISILILFSGVVQSPIYLADVNAIPQFFGVLIMSVAWAIPMTLLFESPIITIEKSIFGGGKRTAPLEEAEEQKRSHLENGTSQNAAGLKV